MPRRILLPSLLSTSFLIAAGGAFAQGVPFGEIDLNNDGFLDFQELADVFGDQVANELLTQDTNGDGALTVEEIIGDVGGSDGGSGTVDDDDDEDDDEDDDDDDDEGEDEDDDDDDDDDEGGEEGDGGDGGDGGDDDDD